MLADLALEFNVGAFMFSSMIHPGPKTGDFKDASHLAKQRIEQYCQSLGPSGLRWMYANRRPCTGRCSWLINVEGNQNPPTCLLHGEFR